MRNTRSLENLWTLILEGKGLNGIYGLADHAARPYRRVYDQVARLRKAGLVDVCAATLNGRKRIAVAPAPWVRRTSEPLSDLLKATRHDSAK